jgi:hypothetical protein
MIGIINQKVHCNSSMSVGSLTHLFLILKEKHDTMKGRKKRDGSLDLSTSLIYLLNLLPYFQDKE